MFKYGAVIQARMGSSRLPGKILFKINNIPLIILLIDRLKQVKILKKIVIATTVSKNDDELCNLLKKNNINFYRGSEENVLQRVIRAAKKYKIRNIVQITGDCPLIDPELVSQVISTFDNNKFDLVSNSIVRSYPDGMDVSVFSTKNLIKTSRLTKNIYDLEHVTLFMKRKKKLFNRCNLMAPQFLHLPNLGLTLDEPEDYEVIKLIFNFFWKKRKIFSCFEIVKFLNKNKKIHYINKNVKRKKIPFKI